MKIAITVITLTAIALLLFVDAPKLPQALSVVRAAITASPEEWAHGYKTAHVTATRYKNESIGYNIGFKYPGHENDCDRVELSDFMQKNGGWVYQGGGSLGAEMFVIFKDVTDKETANVKLKAILPALETLVKSL